MAAEGVAVAQGRPLDGRAVRGPSVGGWPQAKHRQGLGTRALSSSNQLRTTVSCPARAKNPPPVVIIKNRSPSADTS